MISGEVQVWDMGREDDALIATSGMGSDSHREPVTKVKYFKYNARILFAFYVWLTILWPALLAFEEEGDWKKI